MATDHNALKVEMLVMYKECMHNHAASSRGFLLDGCGLFEAPSGTTTGSREAMFCAVCGCHRNFHQRVAVEIPQHHCSSRSSSIRHHHHQQQPASHLDQQQQQQQPASHPDQQQQPALHPHQPQQPASHPDQQQQPALHPHQPQQPASHHHHHRFGGGSGSGRGTMIIRREPASAPGRFAPEQAAARRQRGAPPRHAEGTSAAPQEVPPQHGVCAPRRKRITRAQSEMVRALTERNDWKMFREYSQAEVLHICSDFGITTLALKNCISSLHRRRRKAAIAAIDQH